RTERDDGIIVGEMDDIFVLGIARPRHVFFAECERRADRMKTMNEFAIAELVKRLLSHARHHAHADRDIGRIRQLHADMRDRRTNRSRRVCIWRQPLRPRREAFGSSSGSPERSLALSSSKPLSNAENPYPASLNRRGSIPRSLIGGRSRGFGVLIHP